ncbi:MAG: L-threonylcarbamoyladenylate synthase [Alphaproteobacteria bacterium]
MAEDEAGIARAAACLRAGQVIVMPTDTLYGLGADATDPAAVARVFAIKGRLETSPLLVLVRDLDEAKACGRIEGTALRAAERFWPGPLTLVVRRAAHCKLASNLNPLGDTVGLRVPARRETLALIRAADRPLAAPSANRSGEKPVASAAEALATFGEEVALVLDGGTIDAAPSSVLEWLDGGFRLRREGALSRGTLEAALGPIDA